MVQRKKAKRSSIRLVGRVSSWWKKRKGYYSEVKEDSEVPVQGNTFDTEISEEDADTFDVTSDFSISRPYPKMRRSIAVDTSQEQEQERCKPAERISFIGKTAVQGRRLTLEEHFCKTRKTRVAHSEASIQSEPWMIARVAPSSLPCLETKSLESMDSMLSSSESDAADLTSRPSQVFDAHIGFLKAQHNKYQS